jgi:hypothetical protein
VLKFTEAVSVMLNLVLLCAFSVKTKVATSSRVCIHLGEASSPSTLTVVVSVFTIVLLSVMNVTEDITVMLN